MKSHIVLSVTSSLALSLACFSLPSFGANIPQLLAMSDAVIIGTPAGFVAQTNFTTFNLSVVAWLSPTPAGAPQTLPVVWTAPAMIRQGAQAASPGIWFLKNRGDGTYAAVSVRKGVRFHDVYFDAAARGACPAQLTSAPSAGLAEKIALEVTCSVALGNTTYEPAASVGAAYTFSSSPAIHGACTYLAQMSASLQKSVGIACLLVTHDPSAMLLLEQSLPQLSDQDLLGAIAPVLGGWRSADPAAIQSLGRMAIGPRAKGRLPFEAALGLQEVHTKETLPFLAKLVDSPDRDTRIRALGGFVEFVNGMPIRVTATTDSTYYKGSPTPYSADAGWKSCTFQLDSPNTQLDAAAACWKAWLASHPELPQVP